MQLFTITASLTLAGASLIAGEGADAPRGPMSDALRRFYEDARGNILAASASMPDEQFRYRPAQGVRTFGELLGHIADGQYAFCSAVRGEPNPIPVDPTLKQIHKDSIEKSKTSSGDLRRAAREAFAYCDSVFATATDRSLPDRVKLLNNETSKAGVLTLSIYHLSQHYGNLVVYMRARGVVPPSAPESPR